MNIAHYIQFSLRALWRDWRGGDLRLLSLALLLAVASVTSVGFFTDRVESALHQQANELLAADLVIESSRPLPDNFAEKAAELDLRTSRSLSFPSVILVEEGPELVQVKAVDSHYPLRGVLRISQDQNQADQAADGPPPAGALWVEPRLPLLLKKQLGDSVNLGNSRFRLDRLITLEPDRGGNLFQLSPRVLLNMDDLPATGLVTPASRVKHRLMLAGEARAIHDYRAWSKDILPLGARLLSVEDARPEFSAALERGGAFLRLAALVAVIITGAAVVLSTRRLVERQSDAVAVMRCLGAGSGFLRNVLLLRLLALLLITGLPAALIGYWVQDLLAGLISQWLARDLPPPSLLPIVTGLGTGALTLLGFALPALLRLPQVPPLRVLRRDLGPTPPGPWLAGLAAFGALALLLWWQAGDVKLAGAVLGGIIVLAALLVVCTLGLLWVAERLQSRVSGIRRFGLAALSRHKATTVLQVSGFGLGIMAMLLLAVVRVDLLSSWEKTLPADAPNRFLINVLPEQVGPLADFLNQRQVEYSGLHPMVRGRLTHINEQKVVPEDYRSPRAQRLSSREFNLSFGLEPQSDNRIVAGNWWEESTAQGQFSVEEGIADVLGIELGDTLSYDIAGQTVKAVVSNLRSVQWDSFNVNFFVMSTPDVLRDHPATYVTSFFLPAEQEQIAVELVREFPNVTALDVSALLNQVRLVMERGSTAVEYVFAFTLIAGLLVLYAGIQAGAEWRQRESAVLRTLGVRGNQLMGAAAVEFAALGLLAGLLATLGAGITGWVLAEQVFQLSYGFSPWLWLIGVGGSTLGIGLAGLLAARPLVLRPPLESLRRAE